MANLGSVEAAAPEVRAVRSDEAAAPAPAVQLDNLAAAANLGLDAVAIPANLDRDELEPAASPGLDDHNPASLDPDVRNLAIPGLDVHRLADHTPDLRAVSAQTLDPLVEKVQLVAKFLAEVRWGVLPSPEVSEDLDQVVRERIRHNQGLPGVQGKEGLDQGDQVVKEGCGQDDQGQRRMEGRCNTKFVYALMPFWFFLFFGLFRDQASEG